MSAQIQFASRLDTAMRNAGFKSQSALARAAGIPQPTVNRLLKGTGVQGPESGTVRKLASACGVAFDWLLNGDLGGDRSPIKLSEQQVKWLSLLDSLGSDDIAEFAALIAGRQQRNLVHPDLPADVLRLAERLALLPDEKLRAVSVLLGIKLN